jgi:carbonic anhydrase/acetyltransferase-like protein (isoleucine patch superfamily)
LSVAWLVWFGVQVWVGSPAKFLRHLTEEEQSFIAISAKSYARLAEIHSKENCKTFEGIEVDKLTRKK